MSTGDDVSKLVSKIQESSSGNNSLTPKQRKKAHQLVYCFESHVPNNPIQICPEHASQAIGGQHNSGNDTIKKSEQTRPKGWFAWLLDLLCNPEWYAKGFHWVAPYVTICCVLVPMCVNTFVCFKQVKEANFVDKQRMKELAKGPVFDTWDFLTKQLTSTLPGLAKIIEWVFDLFMYYFLGMFLSHFAPTVLPVLGVPPWLAALLSGTGQGVSSCLTSCVSLLGKIPWRGIVKNTAYVLVASALVFVLLVTGMAAWDAVLDCWTNAWSYMYNIVCYVLRTAFVALCVIHCAVGKLHAFLYKCHFVGELRAHQEELQVSEVQIETIETYLSEAKTKQEKWIDVLCTVSIIAVQCMDFTEGYVLQRYFFGLLARLVWLVLESSSDREWRYDVLEWSDLDMCKKYVTNTLQQNNDTRSALALPDVLDAAYPGCDSQSVSQCRMSRSVWMYQLRSPKWGNCLCSVTFDTHSISDILPYHCLKSKDANLPLEAFIGEMDRLCRNPLWATKPVILELVKACSEEDKSSAFYVQVKNLESEVTQCKNDSVAVTTHLEECENPTEFTQLKMTPCEHLLMKYCLTIVAMVLGVLLSLFLWVNSPTLTTVESRMVEDENGIHPIPQFLKPGMCNNFTNSTYKATFYECGEKDVEGDASKEHTNTTQAAEREISQNVSAMQILYDAGHCLGTHWDAANERVAVTVASKIQEAKCHVLDAFKTLMHLLHKFSFPVRNLKDFTAKYLQKYLETFQSTVQALEKGAINTVKETVEYVKKVRIWLQSFVVKGVYFDDLPWHVRWAIRLLATLIRLVLLDIFKRLS